MPVRGPVPKNPALRQRRNKVSTRALLKEGSTDQPARQLPRDKQWHPRTRRWWAALWDSPMAPEFLDVDRFALYRLAHLVDLAHWCPADIKLEAEIARQEQRFGLTPLDRRRLQWEVKRVEGEKRKPAGHVPSEADPRAVLRAVK